MDSEYVDTISSKYAKAVDADLEFASVDALTLVPALPNDDTPIGRQRAHLREMLGDFTREINRGKSLGREFYSNRLMQSVNMRLFGLLGDPALVPEGEQFPRAAALAKTREGFHADLAKMAEVAGRWTMKGDRVHINADLQFSVGGESMRFFSTLFWLRRLMGEGKTGRYHAMRWADRAFGVCPGDGRRTEAIWRPEETAVVVRKSIADENTINRVGRIVNDCKSASRLNILSGRVRSDTMPGETMQYYGEIGFMRELRMEDIEKLTYRDKKKLATIHRNDLYANVELSVEKICRAENYLDDIPPEAMSDLETLLERVRGPLSTDVPFTLTPELYVLAGPVKIHLQVVPDPLLVLRFAEFTNLLVPVAYWLPAIRGDRPALVSAARPGIRIARGVPLPQARRLH